MVITNLTIIKILMMSPSSQLGFFILIIRKIRDFTAPGDAFWRVENWRALTLSGSFDHSVFQDFFYRLIVVILADDDFSGSQVEGIALNAFDVAGIDDKRFMHFQEPVCRKLADNTFQGEINHQLTGGSMQDNIVQPRLYIYQFVIQDLLHAIIAFYKKMISPLFFTRR